MTPLQSLLTDPAAPVVDMAGLLAIWRQVRITVTAPGAARFFHGPNAMAKLRGAWGRALALSASAEALANPPRPCPWPAPCAYSVFFVPHGRHLGGVEIPKPFVPWIGRKGADLELGLTLFGHAGDWAGEAAEALVRALRGGIDLVGDRRQPITVTARRIEEARGLTLPTALPASHLVFETPLQLRQGEDVHADPGAFLKGLGLRISGLARWHGVQLALDLPALKAEAGALARSAEWEGAGAEIWVKGSAAQGRRLTMAGITGQMSLPPLSGAAAQLVCLGSETHAGSRTSHGLGRYRVEVVSA